VSIEHICRIAFDEIRAAYPERTFLLETSGELHGRADGQRLQQVLSNLLNNAVRHGARSHPITLSARGEADKITVRVKNYGRPIPPDQLQVIFNPLVQIPLPAAELHEGNGPAGSLGLGLYIAREIVTMHGGTIAAESSEKGGTIFSASLPRNAAAARPEFHPAFRPTSRP
jgi:signal transduction histidine kinase